MQHDSCRMRLAQWLHHACSSNWCESPTILQQITIGSYCDWFYPTKQWYHVVDGASAPHVHSKTPLVLHRHAHLSAIWVHSENNFRVAQWQSKYIGKLPWCSTIIHDFWPSMFVPKRGTGHSQRVRRLSGVFVCLLVGINKCMYVCVYVCMYVYIYIHKYLRYI